MALNLTQLFTAISRSINNAFLINRAQNQQSAPFNALVGLSYVNPAWTAQLAQSYDTLIRNESGGGDRWSDTARIILQAMVTADNPSYGTSIGSSLLYLLEQFQEQSATVKECTITTSVTADALNVGKPAVYVSKTRYDGVIFQNIVAEVGSFVFTNDAYTGTATKNMEPWQYTGAPNVSSLGTGISVGIWDWDWPQGSNVLVTGNNIDAAQEASTSGNYLTNGAFTNWTGSIPAALNNWYLSGGTWGTDIRQSSSTEGIDGGYCVEFIAGTGTTEYISQQFNSTQSDGTNVNAGTSAVLTPLKTYVLNMFLKTPTSVSAGVLTISLRDSSGNVINDQSGTPNSSTISLAGLTTSWSPYQVEFRLPTVLPSDGIIRLRIAITTALTGGNVLMDYVAFAQPTSLYAGGPSVISFANPAHPVESGINPDSWVLTFTNDRGGAQFGWTWQNAINRLFRAPDLILPYSQTPTISDGLITSGSSLITNLFQILPPREVNATGDCTSSAIDCNNLPYTLQIIQSIGTITDITSINGQVEESDTGSGGWTLITSGSFTSVTSSNNAQVITITRTKRYIRTTAVINSVPGTPSAFMNTIGIY